MYTALPCPVIPFIQSRIRVVQSNYYLLTLAYTYSCTSLLQRRVTDGCPKDGQERSDHVLNALLFHTLYLFLRPWLHVK